jgi:hypothetical protein
MSVSICVLKQLWSYSWKNSVWTAEAFQHLCFFWGGGDCLAGLHVSPQRLTMQPLLRFLLTRCAQTTRSQTTIVAHAWWYSGTFWPCYARCSQWHLMDRQRKTHCMTSTLATFASSRFLPVETSPTSHCGSLSGFRQIEVKWIMLEWREGLKTIPISWLLLFIYSMIIFINVTLYNCSCNCCIFILCRVFIVCIVVVIVVFSYCVGCLFWVL